MIMNKSTNSRISHCFAPTGKKAKKVGENRMKICAASTRQNGGKMKQKNTKRKQQQGCDVAKVIDTVE
jgi:hypothetical protein